jgi:hypothetical protein
MDQEFTEFVVRRGVDLLAAASTRTGDRSDAEDLAQRALARAYLRWRRIHADPEPYVLALINRHQSQPTTLPTDTFTDRDARRLALHAIDRGHTIRTRRRALVASGLVAVVALAAAAPYALRYLDPRSGPESTAVDLADGVTEIPGVPTHVIDDTSQPIELVDGWYVAGNQFVLNPTERTYQSFGNAEIVMLSPNGRWVATSSDLIGYRVYDLQRGGSVRYDVASTLGTFVFGPATWSPDGDTLLVPADTGTGMGQFIDVVTQELSQIPGDATSVQCPGCILELTWMPSGTELAAVVRDAQGVVAGLQTFAPDGTPGTLSPLAGAPCGVGAWSPDGRHVIVTAWPGTGTGDDMGNLARIVDARTGEVRRDLRGLTLVQAQWIDNERFLTWEPIPTNLGTADRVAYAAIASLWTVDGELLERWLPPTEIVRLTPGWTPAPLAIHLD